MENSFMTLINIVHLIELEPQLLITYLLMLNDRMRKKRKTLFTQQIYAYCTASFGKQEPRRIPKVMMEEIKMH